MMKFSLGLCLPVLLLLPLSSWAQEEEADAGVPVPVEAAPAPIHQGNVEAGKSKSSMCSGCHGEDGNTSNPSWPKLAGQVDTWFVKVMEDFRSGAWNASMMPGMMGMATPDDVLDLAAFYASLPVRAEEVDPSLADLGKEIYKWGLPDKKVLSCRACHNRNGEGFSVGIPGGIPLVSGQWAAFSADQMRAYRDGSRTADWNRVMGVIIGKMTDEEIDAVAAYMAGLH